MCDDTTTKLCDNLAAQAIELAMAEQREATITAALALPEAEKHRLWQLLDEQLRRASIAYALRNCERNRRVEFLKSCLVEQCYSTIDERNRMEKELEELQRVST